MSRRDIDPDALKVLYRLRQFNHVAYLVGGSVRDLLLGRRPKDFDIGTSAHPYQVKKLFRNCWIIGRRFRLAHVKFGTKVIEVATFRRQVQAGEEVVQDGVPAPDPYDEAGAADPPRQHVRHARRGRVPPRLHDQRALLRHRDVLDHRLRERPGGSARRHRAIDRRSGGAVPVEDPVRMLRAVALAARLDFTIDPPMPRRDPPASPRDRAQLAAAAARGVLQDSARRVCGEDVSRPGRRGPARADFGRAAPGRRRAALAIAGRARRLPPPVRVDAGDVHEHGCCSAACSCRSGSRSSRRAAKRAPGPRLGDLPLARRDVERLRQILGLQRRLRDLDANPRAQRALTHRSIFRDALTWLEIHGNAPEIAAHWKTILAEEGPARPAGQDGAADGAAAIPTAGGADADGRARDHRQKQESRNWGTRRRLLRWSCTAWRVGAR